MIVETQAPQAPDGFPEGAEILHHGGLRLKWQERPDERAFFCRFQDAGFFVPNLTPDAHWRNRGGTRLVRVFALSEPEAIDTVRHHYGSRVQGSIEVDKRIPLQIVDHHSGRVVVWPVPVAVA